MKRANFNVPGIEAFGKNKNGICKYVVGESSYTDGITDAPIATAQRPTLLNGYVTRPFWNVAGVDYAVGVPTATTLVSYTTLSSITGYSVNTTTKVVQFNDVASLTIDGIDFSLNNGYSLYLVNCTAAIVRNCKFGGSNYATKVTTGVISTDVISGDLTVENCTIDGGGAGTASALVWFLGTGAVTFNYNWCKNYPNQVLGINDNGCTVLDYQFNFIEGGAHQTSTHHSVLRLGTGPMPSVTCRFNTVVQDVVAAGGAGENFQFYFNDTGTITAPDCSYNTMISKSPGAATYLVHGTSGASGATTTLSGTGTLTNNYVDVSGATGFVATGSITSWTDASNVNMTTGAPIR